MKPGKWTHVLILWYQILFKIKWCKLKTRYRLSRTFSVLLFVSICATQFLGNWRSVGYVPYFFSVHMICDVANECILEHNGVR